MAFSKIEEEEEEDIYTESEESYCSNFDSDTKQSCSILEDTECQLSNLSITKKKKSRSRIGKDVDIGSDPEEDLKIIESGGYLEKQKVDECKAYLRKNGLRLTGNKDTLIQRIKEHQEILNGGGEKKYPMSSFVLNCKGDACTGDVVMFEQNVYEMYNIASRSASGPPCGTRIVAGRIVKESYGAAKQQHTFTIEVLWSKGEKPLPPLHPLLIKGRNLYRLKTMRQKWEDEEERCKVSIEKHSRGSLARDAREIRVQEKERRKILGESRALKKEKRSRNQFQLNSSLAEKQGIQAQQSGSSANLTKVVLVPQQSSSFGDSGMSCDAVKMGSGALLPHSGPFANGVKMDYRPLQHAVMPQKTGLSTDVVKMGTRPQQLAKPTNQPSQGSGFLVETRFLPKPEQPKSQRKDDNCYGVSCNLVEHNGIQEVEQHGDDKFGSMLSSFNMDDHYPSSNKYSRTTWENECSKSYNHRQPLTITNSYHNPHRLPLKITNSYQSMSPPNRQCYRQQQLCKFYAQGRCKFGDNCKFLHETQNCGR